MKRKEERQVLCPENQINFPKARTISNSEVFSFWCGDLASVTVVHGEYKILVLKITSYNFW